MLSVSILDPIQLQHLRCAVRGRFEIDLNHIHTGALFSRMRTKITACGVECALALFVGHGTRGATVSAWNISPEHGAGLDFNENEITFIFRDDVDLIVRDAVISTDDLKSVLDQMCRGEILAGTSGVP